jgi:hypothetical protein
MKITMLVEMFTFSVMAQYAEYCDWVLARANAKGGQPALIAGFLGKGDQFDETITNFAIAYRGRSGGSENVVRTALPDFRRYSTI